MQQINPDFFLQYQLLPFFLLLTKLMVDLNELVFLSC